MTDLSLAPRISLLDRMAALFDRRPAPKTIDDVEDLRARRAFVMDKLNDNPDAFASAHDVHAMMSLYPRNF